MSDKTIARSLEFEDDVLDRAKAGDKKSIERIIEEATVEICVMIRIKKIPSNDFPDVVQECLIRLLHCIKEYDPKKGIFSHYVRSSISNFLNTFLKNRFQYYTIQDRDISYLERTYQNSQSINLEVEELISTISPVQKDMVKNYFGIRRGESSIDEIAARHHVRPEQVRLGLKEAIRIMAKRGGC